MSSHSWAKDLLHLIIEVLSESGDALRIQLVSLVRVVTPPQQQLSPGPILVPTQPATLYLARDRSAVPPVPRLHWYNGRTKLHRSIHDLRPADCGWLP